jgi:TM2 domain-containing membrane protein YozV
MTGLHKFYLGQPIWGGIYLVLWWTQIPRVACAVEGVWYLTRARLGETADSVASPSDGVAVSQQTQAIATALRELEKLRQEGLISEEEFEQNRRNLLARLG